jgi:hypothetical protein
MAVRNPWLKQKDRAPRYEAPPKDPLERRLERRFSVNPEVVDVVKTLKSRIAKQRKLSEDVVFISPQEYMRVLEPFILHQRLGEGDNNYQIRANKLGMLTRHEVDSLIKQEMGYVGTASTKDRLEAHDDRLRELDRERQAIPKGQETEMRPYLVNISWTYHGSAGSPRKRGSPGVRYSVEAVFYGWDAETTMEAAREFMMDRIVDSSSYKAKAVMDVAEFDVQISEAGPEIAGVMEVEGDVIKKRFGDIVADDKFSTRIEAFFQSLETSRVYSDKDFGYRDSTVKYRWVGNRIVPD